MKKKFSSSWKSSKLRRKQRKYLANAPISIKRKALNSNLSKELRKKYGKRSIEIRKGDTIKIMRGKFKGKKGKILLVKVKTGKINVDGISIKKSDGSKVNVPLKASNLQIIELNNEDKRRNKFLKETSEKKKEEKVGNKEELKEKKVENKKIENSDKKMEKTTKIRSKK